MAPASNKGSRYNPNGIDYNKDNETDAFDDILAIQDKNKDGKVTPAEKAAYRQQQGTTEQVVVVDPVTGEQKITTKPKGDAPPEPTLSAGQFGYSTAFLEANPDVAKLLQTAIDNNWTEQIWVREVERNTEFGRRTTDAQAQFDIEIAGNKAEDWQRKITDRAATLRQQAAAAGLQIPEDRINTFARESVRSGLTDQDTLGFFADQFTMPQRADGQAQGAGLAGESAQIVESIRDMARSYGLTATDEFVQEKTREALRQGAGWQSWLDGQRSVFREQAKLLYPTVADKFDQFTLTDMISPYLNDASELLGINLAQMNTDDPMWTAALNGPNGALSRDEWLRVLKTDKKYGYDQTTRARNEYSSLGNDLLAAFGMA